MRVILASPNRLRRALVEDVLRETTLGAVYSRRQLTSAVSRCRRALARSEREADRPADPVAPRQSVPREVERKRSEIEQALLRADHVADRFDAVCRALGLPNALIADHLGVAPAQVTHWRQGTLPRLDTAVDIAQRFGMSMDRLWGLGAEVRPQLVAARRGLSC